ncbi:MAG: hypothetical protein A2381_17985 [Bdellovibrionales bacterium RIFOXYB1_FULL_37_110]|nr:MAG: hypothetical protein A2417_08775 [Bdellovibrionales bacterium RIFOXYC1_FULL_37_79]OFZ59860.1 MAG: hypothetical protein A2381_17985 [Bdellovibrionales bacterium RIFOXYB1_FULL_37_110]OFZ63043.1 MAG: hypothetical protein A2328_06380 [Bdellovibrionales bacterium RIFOXYB2_FULL_36_6]OFZ65474.1 MAG: hypothetical protein A2577_18520 [Bdellovibrionales bacterium RIFOXYD1_FULL_36_51]
MLTFLSFRLMGVFGAGIVAIIYMVIAWLFRIEEIIEQYDLKLENLVVPFSGKIKKNGHLQHVFIPEDYLCLEFHYNLMKGLGVYFPRASEVYDIVKNENEVFINLKCDDDKSLIIHFKKNIFGFLPKLWVYPGDRGKRGAAMGYFPWGGKLFFYISDNYILNRNENCILLGGRTSVATLPKDYEIEKA